MKLARVHDELGRHSYASECLIHLLASGKRYVEVLVPAHKQRRSLDSVYMEEGIGQLHVRLWILPWRPEFVVVLQNVLINPVHAEQIRSPCSAGSRLEASGGRNHIVGQNAAITPSPDHQLVGIDLPGPNCSVDNRHQVSHFLVAPITSNDFAIRMTSPRTATVIYIEHGIPMCREQLPINGKSMLILRRRPAMNEEEHGRLLACLKTWGHGEQPMNLRSVLTLAGNVLR